MRLPKIPKRLLPVPKVWVPAYGLFTADVGVVIKTGKIGRDEIALLVVAALWAIAGYAAPAKT